MSITPVVATSVAAAYCYGLFIESLAATVGRVRAATLVADIDAIVCAATLVRSRCRLHVEGAELVEHLIEHPLAAATVAF